MDTITDAKILKFHELCKIISIKKHDASCAPCSLSSSLLGSPKHS